VREADYNGIAKLLEPDADTTVTSIRMMTPECASPEQVRGELITTSSEIYSQGVVRSAMISSGRQPCRRISRETSERFWLHAATWK
jgi:hypothetical protein